jgi:hypothetical protein
MVIAESEFTTRAEHPVRGHSSHLAPGDLETTRQHRTDWSERYEISKSEVRRPAHNLEWTLTSIDDDEANLVGAFDRSNLINPCHDDVIEPFADVINLLDHETEVVEREPKHLDVIGEGGKISKPRKRYAHERVS